MSIINCFPPKPITEQLAFDPLASVVNLRAILIPQSLCLSKVVIQVTNRLIAALVALNACFKPNNIGFYTVWQRPRT